MNTFPVLVRVAMPDDREIWLSGEQLAPGLFVTPAVKVEGFTGGWAVTHEASGMAFGSLAACLFCIHEALPTLLEVDWTRTREELASDQTALAAGLKFATQIASCAGDCS